jgi:hypothetical protein
MRGAGSRSPPVNFPAEKPGGTCKANRPANAGAHSVGPHRGPFAAPPTADRQSRPGQPNHQGQQSRQSQKRQPSQQGQASLVAWLPYLVVLAGAVAGLVYAGTGHAGRGAGVVGGALLVAAAARLVLPARYAGLLASRGKALDVAAFTVLGAAVLALAVSLP